MPRPFRIEIGGPTHGEGQPSPDGALTGVRRGRLAAAAAEEKGMPETEMWGMLGEIQSRLDTVKTEISALRVGPGSARRTTSVIDLPETNQSRNAEELHGVISAMETATNTILAAAEDVGAVAELLAADGDEALEEHAENLLNAMVTIYQACNFQDISGQRLARVISSLSLIDAQMTELLETWRTADTETPVNMDGHPDELLNGPASEGDEGVVSQNDIDALFG